MYATNIFSPVEILANPKKFKEIYNLVLFKQKFMGSSIVHLVNLFLVGKNSCEQKRKCRYFVQNQIFYG